MDALLPFHDQPDTPHPAGIGITHLVEAFCVRPTPAVPTRLSHVTAVLWRDRSP
jgi:hypothetical protein